MAAVEGEAGELRERLEKLDGTFSWRKILTRDRGNNVGYGNNPSRVAGRLVNVWLMADPQPFT